MRRWPGPSTVMCFGRESSVSSTTPIHCRVCAPGSCSICSTNPPWRYGATPGIDGLPSSPTDPTGEVCQRPLLIAGHAARTGLDHAHTHAATNAGPRTEQQLVVGQQPESLEVAQRSQRTKVQAVQNQQRVGLVAGGQGDVDRVGQVEVHILVSAAHGQSYPSRHTSVSANCARFTSTPRAHLLQHRSALPANPGRSPHGRSLTPTQRRLQPGAMSASASP